MLRIAARDIVEGSTYLHFDVIYESRESFKLFFSSKLSKEIRNVYQEKGTITFDDIVQNYSDNSIDVNEVMNILNITDDATGDELKSRYAYAIIEFGNFNEDSDGNNEDVLCNNIKNILGINDVKSYNNLYYNEIF